MIRRPNLHQGFDQSIMVGRSVQILVAFLVSTIILVQVCHTSAQDNSGRDQFDLMVESVQNISSKLADLYNSKCDSKACSCSQDQCQPLPEDSSFCYDSPISSSNLYNCAAKFPQINEGCASMRITTSRSSVHYVQYGSAPVTAAQKRNICRTQQLDEVFKSIWNRTVYYVEYYVGLVDGSHRAYPELGNDELRDGGGDECRNYDCRKRPWYNGAISYPHHLVILIDCGLTMLEDDQPGGKNNRLQVATSFASALMETVYKGSYINVFSFGADENDTFAKSTQVRFNSTDPQSHSEIVNLTNKISSLSNLRSKENTIYSDFADGLSLSLRAFNETSSQLQDRFDGLLNVIIFTDGSFTDGDISTDAFVGEVLDQVKRDNVHLFLYGINSGAYESGIKNFIDEVNVSVDFRNLRGPDFNDPLLSMHSYFAYLAVSHKNLYNDNVFWSPNYEDYYGVGNIITVAKAVINANNSFIGVAAMDVILDELGSIGTDFTVAVNAQRDVQDATTLGATNRNMPSAPQLFDDSSCNNPTDNFLCVPANYTNPSGRCCNLCEIAVSSPPNDGDDKISSSSDDNEIGIIVGSVVAGVIVVTLMATFAWRRIRNREVQPDVPGGEEPVPFNQDEPVRGPDDSGKQWAYPL